MFSSDLWLQEMRPMRPIVFLAVVPIGIILITIGAFGIYLYTTSSTTTSSSATSASSMSSTPQSPKAPCGWQDSSYQPYGCWAAYLGFLPAGYVLGPHYANGGVYPCPKGMAESQCRQFRASCGNGICDPNESCGSCPIDCQDAGQICNAYTGRGTAATVVCQVSLNATGG